MHRFLILLLLMGCADDEPQEGIVWNDPYRERIEREAAEIDRYCTYVANAQFFSAYAQIPQPGIPPSEHLLEPHRHGLPQVNRRGQAKIGALMSRNVTYNECVRSLIR